jgi:hypothetical protein
MLQSPASGVLFLAAEARLDRLGAAVGNDIKAVCPDQRATKGTRGKGRVGRS